MSLLAFVFDADMPGWFLLSATVAGIAVWALWLGRHADPDDADWVSAAALGFALAVLFGKQAGCNYYYLLAALLLVRMVLTAMREAAPVDTLEAA